MKLNNWSIVSAPSSPYQAPDAWASRITGEVHGHPDWNDGHLITTSAIDKIENGIATTKSGSKYQLCDVLPEYLKTYPNALDVLNYTDD